MKTHNNISNLEDLPADELDIEGFHHWHTQLKRSQQRGLLIIEAERAHCLKWMPLLKNSGQVVILSDLEELDTASVRFSKAERLLGLEADMVILDLYSGMSVDVLCMALGLIKAGGLMVWFCPPDIMNQVDPYGQWQGQSQPRFLPYLFSVLQNCPVVVKVKENQRIEAPVSLPEARLPSLLKGCTPQQADLLESMKQWLLNSKQPLFFLTAFRGRGKSTSLGLFVRAHAENRKMVITAASRIQASVLLACLDDKSSARFMAPDALIQQSPEIDCLIIDEAAMIPFSVLSECTKRAGKVIMATTTGGYEGTGQGFQHKFMQAYSSQQYVHATLDIPIRWGHPDLLEERFNQALMFDLKTDELIHESNSIKYQVISKQELSGNIAKLKQVYELLMSAHYRTRPSDLRQLMDDDNQWLINAQMGENLVGVILLNREGGIDTDLTEAIFMGRRRPQGHLLPQMITAQAGIRDFAKWKGLRIQRITVHEKFRRQGIGRELVNQAINLLRHEKLDYIGSCFGLDSIMAPFWERTELELVHISAGKGKSTGRQTVALLQSDLPDVKRAIQVLKQKMQRDLPLWLLGYCNNMIWRDVIALLLMSKIKFSLTTLDRDEIEAYSQGHRGFDLTQPVLQRYLINHVNQIVSLAIDEQQLLVEKVIQNRPWSAFTGVGRGDGRKAVNQGIRKLVGKLQQGVGQ